MNNDRFGNLPEKYEFFWESALGTTLGILSFFESIQKDKQPLSIYVPPNTEIIELSKIFQFPKEIEFINWEPYHGNKLPMGPDIFHDHIKMFSPYFKRDSVNVNGKEYELSYKKKPCIGITSTNGRNNDFDPDPKNHSFPKCRYFSDATYLKIVMLAKQAGYDIIELNSLGVPLADKVYQISQLCDCVIGYEGGIMHLAHILKTPTLMIPWHADEGGITEDYQMIFTVAESEFQYIKHKAHLLHLDEHTHFFDSEKDLFNLTPDNLHELINNTRNGLNNNVFFSRQLSFFEKKFLYDTYLSPFEKQLIERHMTNLCIGGNDKC